MKNEISINVQQGVVYQSNKGTPITDSLKIAQVFGKQHKNILQAVRNLINTAENSAVQSWFYETSYTAENGKDNPLFVMNRDGFSLLAMGLTGAKAMKFKVGFIEQFNQMESALKQNNSHPAIPQTLSEALRLAADQAERIEVQQRQIEEQRPRVLFSQAVETSSESVLIGELAKIICQNGVETGEKRLFRWMRENEYLCSHGERYNQPMQRYVEMGLFEMKKTSITKPNGETIVQTTTKVTGKGQVYFVNKFLYKHNQLQLA